MLAAYNATTAIRDTYFKYGAWLGLGPLDSRIYHFGDSWVLKLKDKGLIPSAIFTMLVNSTTLSLTLGGYNQTIIKNIANRTRFNESLIKWQNMTDVSWKLQYTGLFMNDTIAIQKKAMTALIDLNIANIRVPKDHLRIIMEYIMKYKDCVKVDETPQSLFTCKCRNYYDC